MPGHYRLSVDLAAREAADLAALGVGAVLLFGIPRRTRTRAAAARGMTRARSRARSRAIKAAAPALVVWADVCLCEYTDHGHCGILTDAGVDNDASLPLLARAAVCYARAGADVIAPSDMMDGRVAAIRAALDEAGFVDRAIVSYAVKYASAFYGPFREAAGSTPRSGDRRAYQMDAPNVREAIREATGGRRRRRGRGDGQAGAAVSRRRPRRSRCGRRPGRGLPGVRRVRDAACGRRSRLDRSRTRRCGKPASPCAAPARRF